MKKTKQARLRDRLATTDLRLSVQLDAAATVCDAVQAATLTGRVVHGARRAQLDSAHAQRIIGITSDGDQGLIALQACQAYAKKFNHAVQIVADGSRGYTLQSYCVEGIYLGTHG